MISRDEIFRIHAEVNECEYEADLAKYGVPEKWTDIMTAATRANIIRALVSKHGVA